MNSLFERVHRLDTLAFLWLHVTKRFPYRKSVRWISRTGDGHLYVLAAIAIALMEPQSGTAFVMAGAIAYTLDVSLYLVLKNAIKRDRPAMKIDFYEAWITPSDQFSFPSGHTAAAFLFAALIASFYPAFALPCYLWASLIGASRVLLGVHYPSDIAAGALLGSGAALVGLYLAPLLRSTPGVL
ncbi:phosphatase PAP2 family protein [Marinimicrobium agarilyticum]|uniref:phosphatase PAP2 family protein n=1 Tax=Marinimicrobium agarilyticum TaxID=306546 RepID=UPI00041AA1A2|nr:phosphatase PAP2 family protein [Marinimicrobium agarilyticum]